MRHDPFPVTRCRIEIAPQRLVHRMIDPFRIDLSGDPFVIGRTARHMPRKRKRFPLMRRADAEFLLLPYKRIIADPVPDRRLMLYIFRQPRHIMLRNPAANSLDPDQCPFRIV